MDVINEDVKKKLKSCIERLERLEEEKKNIMNDIKDVFAEAKSHGFDTKVMKHVLKIRAQDHAELAEHEEMVEVYKHALDMV
jgi:uncharacterized protein (UPF0335 family)